MINTRFDIYKLNGKPGRLRDWLRNKRFPPRLIFFIVGIASTIWFLVRVIPKPSRAGYPCMRVAAPAMAGFIVYLLSLSGIVLAIRKAKHHFVRSKYILSVVFVISAAAAAGVAIYMGSQDVYSNTITGASGPDDGPNQPIGKPSGTSPGRVVWIWNPDATNENCTNDFLKKDYFFKPENTDQKAVSEMLTAGIKKLSGKPTIRESWDGFFRYLNQKKYNKAAGYKKGEKIFIKVNQGTARWLLSQQDKNNGHHFPDSLPVSDRRRISSIPPTEANPYVVLEILRQLVNEAGVEQSDIFVGDPMSHIYGHNYEVWHKAFPEIKYIDKFSEMNGRTMIIPTEKDLLFYSDKSQGEKLFTFEVSTAYLINIAHLKPHVSAGITLTAKNHFGSHARATSGHLHYSLLVPGGRGSTNFGYK